MRLTHANQDPEKDTTPILDIDLDPAIGPNPDIDPDTDLDTDIDIDPNPEHDPDLSGVLKFRS